jgi:3-hydroxyacyl-CoA dehydrogenase
MDLQVQEMGTGIIENIDHAIMAGAGHPMGPFAP